MKQTRSQIQDKINFTIFCGLIDRYVLNPLEEEKKHQLYIDYKEMIAGYYESPTKFILDHFQEWNLFMHGNCLKRNKNK